MDLLGLCKIFFFWHNCDVIKNHWLIAVCNMLFTLQWECCLLFAMFVRRRWWVIWGSVERTHFSCLSVTQVRRILFAHSVSVWPSKFWSYSGFGLFPKVIFGNCCGGTFTCLSCCPKALKDTQDRCRLHGGDCHHGQKLVGAYFCNSSMSQFFCDGFWFKYNECKLG